MKQAEEQSHEWTASQWLQSLQLHECLLGAFSLPEPGSKQFNYIKRLTRAEIWEKLSQSDLVTMLVDTIHEGVEKLSGTAMGMQDGAVSSDKFQTNAKFQMTCGGFEWF